ncbi:MAG: SDR family oxidoreductase [Coriobacteriales bacterium]|nr:SDR family oxidoreductase [Actinomycetes bacterium]
MGLVEGKVALVTGAGSGIGRESARTFAREGAKVVVADIMEEGGRETVRMIKDAGGEAAFVKCDVSKDADVQAAVQFALDTYGKLDCAHNNAGIEGPTAATGDISEEAFDKILEINLKGEWLAMRHEIPVMLAAGKGAIVNTASIAGVVAFMGMPAYTASKFGVNGITKVAAVEYAKAGIRVNSVCPGVIHTAMVDRLVAETPEMEGGLTAATPMGRMGEPQEIAEAVVWLCSDRASFVTGHNMVVDGGYTAQ